MTQQWVSADLRTGQVIADLPALDVEWPLRRTLSNFDTATAHLNLSGAPSNWPRAVFEGGAVLALYDDETLPDGTTPRAIQWAGYVVSAVPRAASDADVVDLSLTTLEGYLDRRDVGDETYTDGWRAIVADLIAKYVLDGAEPGLQLLQLDYDGDGAAPDPDNPIVMQNADNATVLDRINELIQRFGGEFTIEWAFSTDQEFLVPTLVMGDRIGSVATQASPAVTFQMPGPVTAVSQTRDYSDGQGANKVVAFSNGQGTITPYAAPVFADNFQGRPTFEHRYSPQSSQDDTTVLQSFAEGAARILGPGAQSISLTIATSDPDAIAGRRLGVDWRLGDDIGYVIGGLGEDGKDTVLAFPGGISGTGRVIAYDLNDAATISPVFAQPAIYEESTS